jgi:predicted nucleotidyltransferase
MISLPVLQEIIKDTTTETSTIKRIGITGSYVRGDTTERSDIDLIFDIEGSLLDDAAYKAGTSIKSIVGDQFGHDVDVIIYGTILAKIEKQGNPLAVSGYKQMLNDLKWIWRFGE